MTNAGREDLAKGCPFDRRGLPDAGKRLPDSAQPILREAVAALTEVTADLGEPMACGAPRSGWRRLEQRAGQAGQGSSRMSGVTLDAGALIALDRDDRKVLVLLARAKELGARVTVPEQQHWLNPCGAQRRRRGWRG